MGIARFWGGKKGDTQRRCDINIDSKQLISLSIGKKSISSLVSTPPIAKRSTSYSQKASCSCSTELETTFFYFHFLSQW